MALAPDCVGAETEGMAKALKPGELLMLENLRFHEGETANDDGFAEALARLGPAMEAFYRGKRVALHERSYAKGQHSTKDEHMPPAHRQYRYRRPDLPGLMHAPFPGDQLRGCRRDARRRCLTALKRGCQVDLFPRSLVGLSEYRHGPDHWTRLTSRAARSACTRFRFR